MFSFMTTIYINNLIFHFFGIYFFIYNLGNYRLLFDIFIGVVFLDSLAS